MDRKTEKPQNAGSEAQGEEEEHGFRRPLLRRLIDLCWTEPEEELRPEDQWPYHPRYFRMYGRDLWADAILAGSIAIALGLVYLSVPSVRHVADAAAGAAIAAIHKEVEAGNNEEPNSEHPLGFDSVITTGNRARVHAVAFEWLRRARPELSFEQRFLQVQEIDWAVTHHLERQLAGIEDAGATPYSIGDICLAGPASRPALIVAVAPEDGQEGTGSVYWLTWNKNAQSYPVTTIDEECPFREGTPALRAVDLDGDGSTEIIETWHTGAERTMFASIHRLVSPSEWECVDFFFDCVAGELKVIPGRRGALPQIAVAEEAPADEDDDTPQVRGYYVAVYSWHRESKSLRRVNEYFSDIVRT